VKLADSQKEKEMKRLQQMQAQLLNGAGAVGLGALSQQYLAVSNTCVICHVVLIHLAIQILPLFNPKTSLFALYGTSFLVYLPYLWNG